MGSVIETVTDAVGLTNHAGNRAQNAQQNATNSANATLMQMYQEGRKDLEPYRNAGTTALGQLQGDFMSGWQKDPGYDFRMQEGNKAINNAAAARGLGNSGATLKALTRYGQDYASGEYQKAYDRNYSRLSQLAGIGSGAAGSSASAAMNYGQGVSQNQIGMGNAAAANQVAGANRLSGLVGQGMGAAATFFSDLRLKTNIEPASKADLAEMKSHLRAFAYNYKNDEHGTGDWVGVMAQDLEKSKLGRTLVTHNAAGEKMIDTNKVMSLFLATMAEG